MAVWFTADLHFGHSNIITYSHRPFVDVDEMDSALIEGWNDTVAPADTVWVLGDVALGRITASLGLIEGLNGDKRLVAGNHDRCWAGHGERALEWTARYVEAGFSEVHQGTVDLALGEHQVRLCHFPYQGDSHDHDRHVEHRPIDDGAWLLHGHVHARWRQRGRMINVGVDAWAQRPVAAAVLCAMIADGPAALAPLSVTTRRRPAAPPARPS